MGIDPTVLRLIFWGLYTGSVYISLAVGLNIIFGVMKVVNFAHGELMVLGAYITWSLSIMLGLNPYISLIASMAIMTMVGMAVERLCFRRVLGTGKLNEIFVSLGLITFFQNLMCYIWLADSRRIISPFQAVTIPIGAITLPLDYLAAILITAVALILLHIFLKTTHVGRGLRATSQNRKAAMLMGVNVERADMLSFGLGCALAAIAGSFLGMMTFSPYSGSLPAIKAFVVIILGGLGSIPGAIIGGLLLGLTENTAAYLIGGSWKDAVAFIILIIVLAIKPTGLFGEAE